MKTTIDLPDDLADRARALAVSQRTTLRDLVISGLRAEVEHRSFVGAVDFVFPTVSGHGLVADLDPTAAIPRSYGLPE